MTTCTAVNLLFVLYLAIHTLYNYRRELPRRFRYYLLTAIVWGRDFLIVIAGLLAFLFALIVSI